MIYDNCPVNSLYVAILASIANDNNNAEQNFCQSGKKAESILMYGEVF